MIANFVDGLKQGRGCSFVFRGPHRGHLYEGDFENDKYQGVGQYQWPDDEDRYCGQFEGGLRNGWGLLLQENNTKIYSG